MAIELRQQLRLTQQLVMTPQLQQAIKLLQLSQLELVNMVEQELQENPVLEEGLDTDEDLPQEVSREEEQPEAQSEADGAVDGAAATPSEREPSDAEKVADIDWQNYMEAYPQTGLAGSPRDDDERRSLEANYTRRPTLAEHLTWQLQLSQFSQEEKNAAQWIIGNLDDHGYLETSVEEVAKQSGIPEEIVDRSLAKVHTFDPTGVGARDLRECLLIQLEVLDVRDSLAWLLVSDHLNALQKRDFRGVSRTLRVPIEEIAEAARVIGSLEPRPGRAFGGEDPIYIIPDIYIYKIAEDFHIVLNEDGLPKLKINSLYREVLSGGAAVSKETKSYVQEKVRSALWLIKSIHQRQRTIYKVTESIIKYQREFFERGVQFLKPLNLRDVAEDIGMHESTVSRVTTHKYAHTPQGIFELKYFFNSSINRFQGEAIASESVKEKIRRIISAEDARRPLSDQRIAEMLKSGNIDIARRTVTKYREAMRILSSTKRRQVG